MKVNHTNKNGFSLVELSIVLVILGLLVGGVLSGQALIHAAELRTVTKEYGEITTAVHSFRDKYFALPGDMPNATQFWQRQNFNGGSIQSTCVNNSGASVASAYPQGACDGNGDGKIDTTAGNSVSEDSQFWQHLTMAGLLNTLPPINDGIHNQGTNIGGYGTSHFPSANWAALYLPLTNGSFSTFNGNTGSPANVLEMGAYSGNSIDSSRGVMTAEDAWNIDTKLDDGKPLSGNIRTNNNGTLYWADCINGTDYNVTLTYKDCALGFLNAL